MVLNKKDLKKMSHGFNTISSRMMRVVFEEYNMVLTKFLSYIESNEVILDYIMSGKKDDGFNVEEEWNLVVHKEGYMFDFEPTVEEESYQICSVLKYIVTNIKAPQYSFHSIYGNNKWQDNVKEFNDRVVLVLINNINDYLTRIGIDMGLDENVTWNVSGGQVNVASDNAIINAIQNNNVNFSELETIVKNIFDNLYDIKPEDAETIKDSVDMIKDEVLKPEPKSNIISNGIKLLASMITIVNGIPVLVENIQKFIEMVTPYIK